MTFLFLFSIEWDVRIKRAYSNFDIVVSLLYACLPIFSFLPLHCRLKCFHYRYALYLKSKTDFLKILENCDFWLKT